MDAQDQRLAWHLKHDCGIQNAAGARLRFGAGDLIAQSPLTRHLARQHGHLTLPVYPAEDYYDAALNFHPGNMLTARSIFASDPEIKLVSLEEVLPTWTGNEVEPGTQLVLGVTDFTPEKGVPCDQYEWIYRELGLDYSQRWGPLNTIPQACQHIKQVETPEGDYIFLHDTHEHRIERRLLKEGLPIFRPRPRRDQSILAFQKALEMALYVHVIDSAFFHLCDMLMPIGELFLHLYARTFIPVWHEYKTRHLWARLR